jgi:asparagine synthase (glutamine-hydrolysing)
MCGIAGFVSSEPIHPGAINRLGKATAAMARRGPDAEGIHAWSHAILGHRRLAIIDLSDAGRQPMLSDDGSIGLVFNGCIYNFLELRRELEAAGHRFHSRCDTEVILRGYTQWGTDELVRRLRGMFAFAIWDDRDRKLFLVRDRLGVKPLLYSIQGRNLAFGSTLDSVRASGARGRIDSDAILEYLEYGFVTDERSIYDGIQKVPAAAIVEWHDGRIAQRSYWTVPDADESLPVTFEDAIAETEHLLIEAVKARLYADVSVGALLSGGIDSTLVCWAMSKLNANIKAFTVSTGGDEFDETPQASATARALGIAHETVALPSNQSELLTDLTNAYGEPFGCSSALAMMQVSKTVRPMAKVLLTGDGGDEVFLGYPFHRHLYAAQKLARLLPAPAEPLWNTVRARFEAWPGTRRAAHFMDYATGGLGAVTRVHDGLTYFTRRGMLGERLAGRSLACRTIPLSVEAGRRVLTDGLHYHHRTRFFGEFMTKVDGGSMYYSLEARSPFLDQGLWEYASRLPYRIRLHGGVKKAVLRAIVSKYFGKDTATRRKQGFTIPVEFWLRTKWAASLREIAGGSLLEQDGWIERGAISRAIGEIAPGAPAPTQLWFLVVLERWLTSQRGN